MWERLFENRTSKLLERAMDASMIRKQLINQNIANVNTPFYKRLDIDFADALNDRINKDELEMVRTHPMHFANPKPGLGPIKITRETKTLSRYDTNNIDVEFEMAQDAQNTLFFQSITQTWKKRMDGLKKAIEGR